MRLSEQGLNHIREFEGLRLQAYKDSAGVWTIGYGSTRYADGDKVRPGDEITAERAESLLRETLHTHESAIDRLVTVQLSQSQFDALTALVYNIGVGAFEKSTLLKRLNEGQYAKAANEFLRWIHAGGQPLAGLRRRRERERALFLADPTPDVQVARAFASREQVDLVEHAAPHTSDIAADNGQSMSEIPPVYAAPINSQNSTKPMAPVLAALLPSIVGLLPELSKLFGSGSEVAERNVAAAQKVAEIVVQATGAPNLQGAVESMQSDPAALSAASEAVRREWFDLGEKSIAQRQEFAMRYAVQTNVRTVFGTGLTFVEFLSLLLILNGIMAGGYILINQDDFGAQIVGGVITLMIVGGFIGSKDFWLGTSNESRRKTDLLAEKQ